MRILGADLPVVLLTCMAVVFGLWAWVESARQSGARRRMAAWLAEHRAAAWAALPWMSRNLLLPNGISTLKRQGATDDPAFEALEAEAVRHGRRTLSLIFLAAAMIALEFAGMSFLGWSAG